MSCQLVDLCKALAFAGDDNQLIRQPDVILRQRRRRRLRSHQVVQLSQLNPRAEFALIDPDAEEVQQLKSAAMPLLFQLREDQKREVRTLARIIGLEKVASMI